MATKAHIPGGEGERPIGAAKREAQQIQAQWQTLHDTLTTGWSALDSAGKTTALRQANIFGLKALKYLLLAQLGE